MSFRHDCFASTPTPDWVLAVILVVLTIGAGFLIYVFRELRKIEKEK